MKTGRRPCGQRPVGDFIPAALAAGLAAEPASASHSPAAATRLPWRAESYEISYDRYFANSRTMARTPFSTSISYVVVSPIK